MRRISVTFGLLGVLLLALLVGIRLASLWSLGRIGWYAGTWIEVPADPDAGFHVPYRLYVPLPRPGPVRLWLRPNNSGVLDDALGPHHEKAEQLLAVSRWQADWLDAAVLVPSFVRPASEPDMYTHALDGETLGAPAPLGRPDLQLLAMAEDARKRLRRASCDAVFIDGFSASGMFTSRFVALHPERVAAAGVGAPGGWPLVPDRTLPYPAGIADLEGLIGRPVDVRRWRLVPVLHWLGAEDTYDSVPYADSYPESVAERVWALGESPVARWSAAERAFARSASTFRLDPGVGHTVTSAATYALLEHLKAHDDRVDCTSR